MKKIITIVSVACFLLLVFSSCEKKPVEEPINQLSPQQMVAGKWLIETRMSNEHYSDQDHITTLPGNGYDYADFRADGKVYSDVAGDKDTMSYSVPSLTRVVIDGIDFEIKALSQKNFSFYRKATYGSDFDEMTISLKR